MAENFFRFNVTDVASADVHFRGTNNDVVDGIAGCLDYKRQKPVPIGDYYHTDDCTICLCHSTQKMCKQIYCAPPTNCDGFIKKDPLHCCDVCVPTNIIERPTDETSLNMKFGALTVTLFLIVSLILFTFHRLRRKRVLITLRRLRGLRRQDASFSCSAGRDSVDANGQQMTVLNGVGTASDVGHEIRYQIPEAPPSYASAVTLPRPPSALPVLSANTMSRSSVPFGEPPPPYPVAAVDTVVRENSPRRGVLSSVVNALATIRRNRNVESAVNSATTFVVSSQTQQLPRSQPYNVTVNPSASGRAVRCDSVSWHRTSADDRRDYFTDEAASGIGTSSSLSASRNSLNSSTSSDAASSSSCCCSQCDSGVSRDDEEEDDCSLSSNDVRPRSEMSMIRLRAPAVVVNNVNSVEAAATVATPQDWSTATATVRRRLCDSCQMALATDATTSRSTDVDNNIVTESLSNETKSSKRRNVCKRKLKKLIASKRKKLKNVAVATTATMEVAIRKAKSRRHRRRNKDVATANVAADESFREQTTSRTSAAPNELMTSV